MDENTEEKPVVTKITPSELSHSGPTCCGLCWRENDTVTTLYAVQDENGEWDESRAYCPIHGIRTKSELT